MSEAVRGGLHWVHEGRKALWVPSSRPKVISAFTRLKLENQMDETAIFGLENVKLPWRGWH